MVEDLSGKIANGIITVVGARALDVLAGGVGNKAEAVVNNANVERCLEILSPGVQGCVGQTVKFLQNSVGYAMIDSVNYHLHNPVVSELVVRYSLEAATAFALFKTVQLAGRSLLGNRR